MNGNEIPKDQATQDLDDSAKGRSCEVSPDDKIIAIGCKDGTLRVIYNLFFHNINYLQLDL